MPETNKYASYLQAIMDALKGNDIDYIPEPTSNIEYYLKEIAIEISNRSNG